MATPVPVPPVTSLEEWARRPRAERLARLGRTPGDLAAAFRGVDPAALTRRLIEKAAGASTQAEVEQLTAGLELPMR